jgi:serine/threonine-protein kinase
MGEVWLATDLTLQRKVAVKIIRKELAEDPEFAARFFEEMKTVARFRHPNICTVYGTGMTADGRLAMIMELLDGASLRQMVDGLPPGKLLEELPAAFYILQALEAVQEAHDQGVLHRDIKPENLLVRADGHVSIVDFGVATRRQITGEIGKNVGTAKQSTLLGTARYMAPELIEHGTADPRSDLYSMGVTAHVTLAREFPYPGIPDDNETGVLAAHVHLEPVPLAEARPGCSEAMAAIVARLLAKNPQDRYQSAGEAVMDLSTLLRSSVPPDHPIAKRVLQDRERKARRAAYARHQESSVADRTVPPIVTPPDSTQTGDRAARLPDTTKPLPAAFVPPSPASSTAHSVEVPATPREERSTIPLPASHVPASPCAPGRLPPPAEPQAISVVAAVTPPPEPPAELVPKVPRPAAVPIAPPPGAEAHTAPLAPLRARVAPAPGIVNATAGTGPRAAPAAAVPGRRTALHQLLGAVGAGLGIAVIAAMVLVRAWRPAEVTADTGIEGGATTSSSARCEPPALAGSAPGTDSGRCSGPRPADVRGADDGGEPVVAPRASAAAPTASPTGSTARAEIVKARPSTPPTATPSAPIAAAASGKRPVSPPQPPADETPARSGKRKITPPPWPASTAQPRNRSRIFGDEE